MTLTSSEFRRGANFVTDADGRLKVTFSDGSGNSLGQASDYATPGNIVSGTTAAITNTSDTSVIAAQGAGVRTYITSITVTNSHATTDTVVEVKDGSTVIFRQFAKAAGGGFSVTFPTPLRGTANTAVNAANVTNASNTYVSVSGFKASV